MKSGIIGARRAGKSTVFHALTGIAPAPGLSDARNRAQLGQIKVADERLDFLESVYGSKKKVPVELTLFDFAANPKEHKPEAALDPTLLPLVRDMDALLMVVAEFGGERPALADAAATLDGELVFSDFDQLERRVERLRKEKGPIEFERATLQRCMTWLEHGKPLRTLDMTAQELAQLSSFALISRKPALVVVNCEADRATAPIAETDEAALQARGLEAFRLAAAFEAELWELDPAGHQELLRDAGLEAPARERLVRALYRHLGLVTFYTAGEPEAHAWPLRRGATALEAAARIHSDIARGFIRAEVISFEDFARLRSEARVREAGKLRLEGRDSVINDGDIIHVRFKV